MTPPESSSEPLVTVATPPALGEPDGDVGPVTPRAGRSLRGALVFGAGSALQRGIAFLLLPVYTRALTPAQYGTLSVLLAVTSAAGIVFAFGLDMGLFRSFFQYENDPEGQRRFLGTMWRFLLVAPLIGAVVVTAIAAPLVRSIPRVGDFDVFLAVLAGAFYVGASAVPLVILRVRQRLRDFMLMSVVDAVATPALTLVFVVWLHDGIMGWLIAAAGSNLILLLGAMVIVPWDRRATFDRTVIAGALRFGIPLIPHAFALWALLLIDRGVLAGLVSAHQLGIYSLAANLGVPVAIAVQSLNQAMMPVYAAAGVDPARREHLQEMIVLQLTGVLAICLAGALLGGPVLVIMAAPAYRAAAPLVVWIVLGYGFMGLYFVPMNGITLGAGRNAMVWVVSVLGAASNVVLLIVFVPSGGLTAAAIASAAAYAVLFAGISIYARHPDNPVSYRWSQLLPVAGVAGVVYVAARLTTADTGGTTIVLRIAWILLFLGLCAILFRARAQTAQRTSGELRGA